MINESIKKKLKEILFYFYILNNDSSLNIEMKETQSYTGFKNVHMQGTIIVTYDSYFMWFFLNR